MNKKDLWLKLTAYHFDHLVPAHLWDIIAAKFGGRDASTKAFATKLSRKLDWDRTFALRAIWEYKKFVYLGVISDFIVTPSKVIDQVWHEHLLFSAGYRKFCEEVINYNLDHNPELVAVDSQTETFQVHYLETIELYITEFGSVPPDDIWAVTKFDENTRLTERQSRKKQKQYANDNSGSSSYYDSDPLITAFPNMDASGFDFGGGDFGGGGASGSWGDSDSSSGDSGDSGSSCSSGCGGGD